MALLPGYFQSKLFLSVLQHPLNLIRIFKICAANHKVICITDQVYLSLQQFGNFLHDPQIQHMV